MRKDDVNEKEVIKGGRPKAVIDWLVVDQLLISGCSGTEIAAYIGIYANTLYDRCLTDNKILFSEYSQEKQAKGDSILRAHQFNKALGKTEKGDNTLLIWLGKNRLKQRDNHDHEITEKALHDFSAIMTQLKGLQEGKSSDSSTSTL